MHDQVISFALLLKVTNQKNPNPQGNVCSFPRGLTKKRQEVTRSAMKCQEASRDFFFVFFIVFIVYLHFIKFN